MALNDFVTNFETAKEAVRAVENMNDSRGDAFVLEAYKEARKYADQIVQENPDIYDGAKAEDIDIKTKEGKATIETATRFSAARAEKRAAKEVNENLDVILSEIPGERLEGLALSAEIQRKTSDDGKKVIEKYAQYEGYKDLVDKYEAGEKIGEDGRKEVAMAAAKGMADAQRVALSNEDESVRELGAQFAMFSASLPGYIPEEKRKEYALVGLKATLKEREDAYKKAGNVGDIVKTGIKAYAESPDAQDFRIAQSLVYTAAKGPEKTDEDESGDSSE